MSEMPARSKEDIGAAVREVENEAAGGAEALYMAAMLARAPLPYDFALSVEGTPHNPALSHPAAAFFAATATIDPLVTRDLITIDADQQIYQIHDDVRDVLLDSMNDDQRLEWAGRAIYGLNLVLPDAEPQHWETVKRLMPHILACRDLVTDLEVHTAAANRVLHQAGFSLYHQKKYQEAAELIDLALAVDVAIKGRQHPDICADLEGLGAVLWAGQQYERAEAAFASCYALQKQIFTEDNPVVAPILNSLAVVRQSLGNYASAEKDFKECLRILTRTHGEEHPSVASCLNNMALLYEAIGEDCRALELAERSLAINRGVYGEEHPEVAADLNTVALLCDGLGDAVRAERFFRQSLGVRKKVYGDEHPETAQSLCNLALCLDNAGKGGEAVSLYEQGLVAYESSLGPGHPLLEAALENYLMLLEKIGMRPTSDGLRVLTERSLRAIVEKAE